MNITNPIVKSVINVILDVLIDFYDADFSFLENIILSLLRIQKNFIPLLISFIVLVIDIFILAKLFKKINEKIFKCFIPFYRQIVLWDYAWKSIFYIVNLILNVLIFFIFLRLTNAFAEIYEFSKDMAQFSEGTNISKIFLHEIIIPFILCVILFIISKILDLIFKIKLSKCFNHGVSFGLGLFVLPFIYKFWLAFEKSSPIIKVSNNKIKDNKLSLNNSIDSKINDSIIKSETDSVSIKVEDNIDNSNIEENIVNLNVEENIDDPNIEVNNDNSKSDINISNLESENNDN